MHYLNKLPKLHDDQGLHDFCPENLCHEMICDNIHWLYKNAIYDKLQFALLIVLYKLRTHTNLILCRCSIDITIPDFFMRIKAIIVMASAMRGLLSVLTKIWCFPDFNNSTKSNNSWIGLIVKRDKGGAGHCFIFSLANQFF